MLKSVLLPLSVSVLFLAISCAPKRVEMPSYEGRTFSEVMSERQDISQIETSFSITLHKSDSETSGDAALTISKTGDMSLRLYSLGFLAMELTSKDGIITSSTKIDDLKKAMLTEGLKDCFFWWDLNAAPSEDEVDYILRDGYREVWIDKKTFLPKKQRIFFGDKDLSIYYDNPARGNDGIWYQSRIRIEFSAYRASINVYKMTFKTSSEPGPAPSGDET